MKKKEVSELMKKFYLYGGIPFAALILIAIIMIFVNSMLSFVFILLSFVPACVATFLFYVKAKKMQANGCIKCVSPKQTLVSEDVRLADEYIGGVLCEVHRVTHTCQDCGNEYTCTEYKCIK